LGGGKLPDCQPCHVRKLTAVPRYGVN
jgi:hypothetical protein